MNEVKFNAFLLDCCVNGEDPKALRVMLPQGEIVVDWSDPTKIVLEKLPNDGIVIEE